MKRLLLYLIPLGLALALPARSQQAAPLRLVQTISMPDVHMRMDHLSVDVEGNRLFAAALGDNQESVEVIDVKAGKRIFSIRGQSKPQGVYFSSDANEIFVANGGGDASELNGEGSVKIFAGGTYKLLETLPMGIDADHVNADPAKQYLYVGYGNDKSGALGIVDMRTNKHIGDIKTPYGPGGIMIEKSRPRIYVRYRGTPDLGVIDREKREVIARWPVTGTKGSYSLALDEAQHRLFDTSRNPPLLIVFDTESGKQISQLESVAGIDDVWYDAKRKRIYASGGRGPGGDQFVDGFVAVYQQNNPDSYELVAKVPSKLGACTSIWVPQWDRLYVSAPGVGDQAAAILVFQPQ